MIQYIGKPSIMAVLDGLGAVIGQFYNRNPTRMKRRLELILAQFNEMVLYKFKFKISDPILIDSNNDDKDWKIIILIESQQKEGFSIIIDYYFNQGFKTTVNYAESSH